MNIVHFIQAVIKGRYIVYCVCCFYICDGLGFFDGDDGDCVAVWGK